MLILVAFGSGLAFLLALANLINGGNKFHPKNSKLEPSRFRLFDQNSTSILFFCVAIVQFHIYLELSDELKKVSWFAEWNVPFLFLIGPFTYLYFEELSGAKQTRIRFFHFLPALFSFILMFPFYFRDIETKRVFLANPNSEDPFHRIVLSLLILGTLSNFLYPAVLFFKVWRWRKKTVKELRKVFSPFLILFAATLAILFLFVIAQTFYMPLFLIAADALTFLISAIFLMSATHSSVVLNFQKESREARYKESRLVGLDVDAILIRLDDRMRIKRIFLDETLTLAKLAKEMDIHTHQLSEILNARLHLTFRDYITQFRLEEAAKLLKEESDRSVLSILYASGFNSKSAFHKLFQERFGCSPSSYRSQ
ncbi:AraC family transcriptional regulator [Leptospira sp. 201903071]|nr:AraC family transcriptional regulator [Leptospira ainazelensis]